MTRPIWGAALCAALLGGAIPATAQEALRNAAPLQFSGGTSEQHIWVSPVDTRGAGKSRFWLYRMPKTDTVLRYFNLYMQQAKYDVNAMLYEADCGARQQVTHLREEYYLDGVSHLNASWGNERGKAAAVEPRSALSIALDTICGTTPASGVAATMAEARRMSDEHFRRTAAPAPSPPKPAPPPAKPNAPKPAPATLASAPQPWECASATRRILGLAEASYGLMTMHDEGVSGSEPVIAKARQRVADEKALAIKLYPELQLTKAQFDAIKTMPRPYEVRERCLAALAARPASQTALAAVPTPGTPPALLWGRYEPGGTTPFYRLNPAQPGFFISLPQYQSAGKSGPLQVILLQEIKASDGSSDSTAHIFSVDCAAKTLWRIAHRKLRDGDIVRTFAADPAATAPETPVAKGVIAAACGSGAMGEMVGSITTMIRAGLIG